jgi:hypothetical protein
MMAMLRMVWLTGVTVPLLLVRDADRVVERIEVLRASRLMLMFAALAAVGALQSGWRMELSAISGGGREFGHGLRPDLLTLPDPGLSLTAQSSRCAFTARS